MFSIGSIHYDVNSDINFQPTQQFIWHPAMYFTCTVIFYLSAFRSVTLPLHHCIPKHERVSISADTWLSSLMSLASQPYVVNHSSSLFIKTTIRSAGQTVLQRALLIAHYNIGFFYTSFPGPYSAPDNGWPAHEEKPGKAAWSPAAPQPKPSVKPLNTHSAGACLHLQWETGTAIPAG